MARSLVGSSLRRLGAPVGASGLLCLVFAAGTLAATPSPDPPPAAVAPEAPPTTAHAAKPTTVARAPVTAPAPVIRRATPVARAQPTPQPAVAPKRAANPKPKPNVAKRPAPAQVERVAPHDRGPVPLAAFVAAGESLDRGLLAVGGAALLLVALGGAVLLGIARRQLMAAAVALFAVVVPAANAAAPPVSYTLSGTPGSNGWFKSNVTLAFTWTTQDLVSTSGCDTKVISSEGINTPPACVVTFTWGSVSTPPPDVRVRIDKTAPTGVTGSLQRAADSDGWYNRPVAASFTGQDAVAGIAACSSATYSGGDSESASLSGTCTDVAGNTSTAASVALKYDATAPAVTPTPERPPDTKKGWYRKPVTFSFAGADATSGLAGCSAPARYAGPDVAQASVTGTCRDRAGNAAEAKLAFQYDATAPKLAIVKAKLGTGVAQLDWERAGDVVRVEIVRAPGINGAKSTTVYQGNGAAFVDRTVKPGIRYRYLVSVADVAGNVSQKAVTTSEPSALFGPAPGAVVRTPPVLRWQAVKGASFYNVQLYRNGVKVLSTWPNKATLKLGRTWSYAGKRQRLLPGTYRWYVWGAKGTKAKPVYGRALGTSTFVVKR